MKDLVKISWSIIILIRFNSFTTTGDNERRLQKSVYPDEKAHHEPSYQDLRCLKFSLSTLHINFFPLDS